MWKLNFLFTMPRFHTLVLILGCQAVFAEVRYPGVPPGPPTVSVTASQVTISNQAICAIWPIGLQGLEPPIFLDVQGGGELTLKGPHLEILLRDGTRYSRFVPVGTIAMREVAPLATSPRLADRLVGQVVEAPLTSPDGRFKLTWRAVVLNEANYLREECDVTAAKNDSSMQSLGWVREAIPNARTVGRVDGSLVVAQNFFFGCEDPNAVNEAGPTREVVGRWTPQDLEIGRRRQKTWIVDPSAIRAATNWVIFQYESGAHRLDVWWLALLEDGREVARDAHHGRAGGEHVDNRYEIVLPAVRPGARYELLAEIGTDPDFQASPNVRADSSGRVELVGGAEERVTCTLQRNNVLKRGETLRVSFVMGVAPAGQLRRASLHYLERERAHPYRPYLHYNSWYDIAWDPFALNETNCLEAIRLFGERFIKPYGVVVDGMVFDDGWDDPKSLWQFHSGFPRGFGPLAELCQHYSTRLGVWLSPFGGYGKAKVQRLQFGSERGFETNAAGFSLAGRKYYSAFKQACVGMIRDFGVNHFKFDGMATGMYASGGGQYLLDTEAMQRLMLDLRQEDPDLFINLTTGSWPSPFWLRYADSLWRQGGDMGHAGKGTPQQQWLTYRDQETYRNIVRKGPLFPVSSLMSQGVAYSRRGMAGDPNFDSRGFRDDVRAFFGSGTGLQELYIQPDKLSIDDWRVLAEAAKWSRTNAEVLVDTHWIGGDPGKSEVYGYASWSPGKGILMLRNPDDQPREATFDVGIVFELPVGAESDYQLKSPWAEDAAVLALVARAGQLVSLRLKPFEVVVLEARSGTDPLPSKNEPGLPALIPPAVSYVPKPGTFSLGPGTGLVASGRNTVESNQLAEALRKATGLRLPLAKDARARGLVYLRLNPGLAPRLGHEGYRLKITPESVHVEAAGEAGLFYGGVTLRQLLPAEAFRAAAGDLANRGWEVPCVEIEDYPRFSWRGLLVDPARHFLPLGFLKKLVDVMALHKLNTLQIHLTDDQGWRLEIKKYPRLTEVGSHRKESPRRGYRNQGDGTPYGPFFYTQEQMREFVAYARARNVTVVPEIEMPGHFVAALAAYPQFSCTGGPFEVQTRWGIHRDILCPGNDEAVRFARDVLEEVVGVFPAKFIHIGGDEAPRDRWKACPKCQARMKAESLMNEAQLQTWFNHRMEEFLVSKDRRMIGWDEILEGGLTPEATVMSWRGMEGGIKAAKAGHDVVMAPTTHCYFDYAQAKDPEEPESIGGFIPLQTAYDFEPVPPSLPAENRRHVLGGQGALWSEFMWSAEDVEYFAFPRAAALSEVLWSPAELRDFESFTQRLPAHLRRLEVLGVNYRRDRGTIRPPKP